MNKWENKDSVWIKKRAPSVVSRRSNGSNSSSNSSESNLSPSEDEERKIDEDGSIEGEGSHGSSTGKSGSTSGSSTESIYTSSSASTLDSSATQKKGSVCGDSDTDSIAGRLRCLDEEEKSEDEEDNHFREPPNFDEIGSYEDYLDHYVSWRDLYYFDSEDVARTITTLGFRVPELLSREDFEKMMLEIRTKREEKRKDDVHIAYDVGAENIICPLMQALAEREVKNRTGNLSCIVFVRTMNAKKQEVSAWIDFRVRLKDDDKWWYAYYTGLKKLIPRPSDLCYYNWSTFQVRFNSSENYLVTTDIKEGLQFMNKLDRKLITVNPMTRPGDNTDCYIIKSPNYDHCILYDHFLRVKA